MVDYPKQISLSVNEEEHQQIIEYAKETNRSVSNFLRKVLLDTRVIGEDRDEGRDEELASKYLEEEV